MLVGGQGTKWRSNIAENFNRLPEYGARTLQTADDRQTDDRQTTDRRKGDDR